MAWLDAAATVLWLSLAQLVVAGTVLVVAHAHRHAPRKSSRKAPRRAHRRGPDGRNAATGAVALAPAAAIAVGLTLTPGSLGLVLGAVLGLVGLALVVARAAPEWTLPAAVTLASGIGASLAYLTYFAVWMVQADLGTLALSLSLALWLLELFVAVLGVGFLWELVDVFGRRRWRRAEAVDGAVPGDHRPFVSLHVPAHEEPPELVIETLQALLRLDYDDYEIVMVDDNTRDEATWRPVESFCARHDRIRFLHLQDRPGYKSGALNEALAVTDPRAEVVGVVDADYVVRPDFLARCAPLFADPDLGFVQTPQDYREWRTSRFGRRLYHSYRYFFAVSQQSRNEVDGAIFGGTMGLIRRRALDEAGGWDEWCITEDAELSLRLLRDGWRGQHLSESFGHGLMPLTFEALKAQRFRWCFGGVQILRLHLRDLLPWPSRPGNQLDVRQRLAYLFGGLQWYVDLAALAFVGFLLAGAASLHLADGLVIREMTVGVMAGLGTLILLGVVRSVVALRRLEGTPWFTSLGVFLLWLALGWAVALGAARGSVAREGRFLRTPKEQGTGRWRHVLTGNLPETVLGLVCAAAAAATVVLATPAAWFVAGLLALHAAGFLAAPVNSHAALREKVVPGGGGFAPALVVSSSQRAQVPPV